MAQIILPQLRASATEKLNLGSSVQNLKSE